MVKKTSKWIWLMCVVFLIMQYLICVNVYVMGDDYMYGTFGHQGIRALGGQCSHITLQATAGGWLTF